MIASTSCRIAVSCLILLSLLSLPLHTQAIEDVHIASVPALAVRHDDRAGVVHYIVIQINRRPQLDGPVVQFSEIMFGGGSVVGDDWKDGVKQAVLAALRQLNADGRDWLVTIKNRSHNAITDGTSASSAVAVGVMAAWRGDAVRPTVALTGQIAQDGNILAVGQIPQKIEAAAREHFTTVLVPRGQLQTAEWDLTMVAAKWRIDIVEVGTLEEAYQAMTGAGR